MGAVNCPGCGVQINFSEKHIGRKVKCPACGILLTIPTQTSEAEQSDVIAFPCPSCGKGFRVPRSYAGKKARCKACGASMQVPAEDQVSPPAPQPAVTRPESPAAKPPAADIQEVPEPEPISAEVVNAVANNASPQDDSPDVPPAAPDSPDVPQVASTTSKDNIWPEVRRRAAKGLLDFVLFRRLLITSVTMVIWLAISVVTLVTAVSYGDTVGTIPYLPGKAGYWIAIAAILIIVRILCETFVVLFRINDSTTDVVTDFGISGRQGKVVNSIGRNIVDFLLLRSMIIIYVTVIPWLVVSAIILLRPLQPTSPSRWINAP